MVRGLDVFREHFSRFEDRYTIIGGTAVFVAMDTAGLAARATKDLDIVICIETLDPEFAESVWEFVERGGYEFRQKSTGEVAFYRFYEPSDGTFPHMLEFFSRKPDVIVLPADSRVTPIPVADEVSSLSAILLDDDYYRLVRAGSTNTDGLTVLPAEYLIPLKAKAWLDLSGRKAAGEPVSGDDVKKHRNDILRLSQIVPPTARVDAPDSVKGDIGRFVEKGLPAGCEPTALGIRGIGLGDVQALLRTVYGLDMGS